MPEEPLQQVKADEGSGITKARSGRLVVLRLALQDAVFLHWKTTVAGVALIIMSSAFLLGRIQADAYMTSVGTLAALGLMAAKDGDK